MKRRLKVTFTKIRRTVNPAEFTQTGNVCPICQAAHYESPNENEPEGTLVFSATRSPASALWDCGKSRPLKDI